MRVDTGADVTVIEQATWKMLGSPDRHPADCSLKAPNGTSIACSGVFDCEFEWNGVRHEGQCYVVKAPILLLASDWLAKDPRALEALGESPARPEALVMAVDSGKLVSELQNNFPRVFKQELGLCSEAKAVLRLKDGAVPVFRRAIVAFHAMQDLVGELERLTARGVISLVNHSKFVAPVVVVRK